LNGDNRIERQMGTLLQVGVLVSAAVMALGGIFYLAGHGRDTVALSTFHKVAWSQNTRVLQVGVLLMIATPVLRVLFAVFAFAKAQDWLYSAVAATVLALILWGFVHPA
jgi:uncharacterized membrane protein